MAFFRADTNYQKESENRYLEPIFIQTVLLLFLNIDFRYFT